MNKIESQLKKLRSIMLSSDEKQRVRGALENFIQNHVPASSTHAIPSPFAHATRRFFLQPLQVVGVAMIIILGSGAGLTYAAQDALPGDALYSIKVNVNEEVRGWAINNPKAKAEYEIDRAAKRLEETAQLALTGRLDNDAVREIQAQLEKHTNRTKKEADKIKTTTPTEDLEVTTKLASELKAHSKALAEIKKAKNINGELTAILTATEQELDEINVRQIAAIEQVKGDNSELNRARMEEKYQEVNKYLESLDSYLVSVSSDMETRLEDINQELTSIDISGNTEQEQEVLATMSAADNEEESNEEMSAQERAEQLAQEQAQGDISQQNDKDGESNETTVSEVKTKTTSISYSHNPALIQEVIATQQSIAQLIEEADVLREEEKYGEALIILQDAATRAQETLTQIRLQTNYEKDMEPAILEELEQNQEMTDEQPQESEEKKDEEASLDTEEQNTLPETSLADTDVDTSTVDETSTSVSTEAETNTSTTVSSSSLRRTSDASQAASR